MTWKPVRLFCLYTTIATQWASVLTVNPHQTNRSTYTPPADHQCHSTPGVQWPIISPPDQGNPYRPWSPRPARGTTKILVALSATWDQNSVASRPLPLKGTALYRRRSLFSATRWPWCSYLHRPPPPRDVLLPTTFRQTPTGRIPRKDHKSLCR